MDPGRIPADFLHPSSLEVVVWVKVWGVWEGGISGSTPILEKWSPVIFGKPPCLGW